MTTSETEIKLQKNNQKLNINIIINMIREIKTKTSLSLLVTTYLGATWTHGFALHVAKLIITADVLYHTILQITLSFYP